MFCTENFNLTEQFRKTIDFTLFPNQIFQITQQTVSMFISPDTLHHMLSSQQENVQNA